MVVVVGEVVGHAREARVHVGAAEVLGADLFACGGLHERRTAEKDRAGALDDDRLVRHRRHVGAAGGARAHDDRDLRDALGRHARLVEEDAAEVLAIGEHLRLQRQEGAARVHEVHAGQTVLERHLLRAQVLLHRDRVVRAALHRGVVRDDHDLAARHAADTGDEARARRVVVVDMPRGQRRELEEGRARIEQPFDALAHGQLALLPDAARMSWRRRLRATLASRARSSADELRPSARGSRGTRRSSVLNVRFEPVHGGRTTSRSSRSCSRSRRSARRRACGRRWRRRTVRRPPHPARRAARTCRRGVRRAQWAWRART